MASTLLAPAPPCAACRLRRRKCLPNQCVFAPYFPQDDPQKFAIVHKIFGASNVGKLLLGLPEYVREDAVNSLVYEAEARMLDPVYGCVGVISLLKDKLCILQQSIILYNSAIAECLASYVYPDQALYANLFISTTVPRRQ
ncbi:hypothetical protein L7F22_028066 [Adiantum nelumboides]|nr:hypothetical protein [Adiantum nelumboides]